MSAVDKSIMDKSMKYLFSEWVLPVRIITIEGTIKMQHDIMRIKEVAIALCKWRNGKKSEIFFNDLPAVEQEAYLAQAQDALDAIPPSPFLNNNPIPAVKQWCSMVSDLMKKVKLQEAIISRRDLLSILYQIGMEADKALAATTDTRSN